MKNIADMPIIRYLAQEPPHDLQDLYEFFWGYDIMSALWRIYAQDLKYMPDYDLVLQSTHWVSTQCLFLEEGYADHD